MQSLMDVGVNMSAFSISEIIVKLQLLVKCLYESWAIALLVSNLAVGGDKKGRSAKVASACLH